jgi:hypothetical protein
LSEQKLNVGATVNLDDPNRSGFVSRLARSYSLRMALYMAVWELVTANELLPAGPPQPWEPSLGYKTSYGSGSIDTPGLSCTFLDGFHRPPPVAGMSTDPDIFLEGVNCRTLHPGILEAVEQTLACFRSGLYMPATVMMAAAAEAAWTECGAAVASKIGLSKLHALITDQQVSIARKVTKVREALQDAHAKPILTAAAKGISQVVDAELWTTVLRDRRNALHWGKAKSFVADHSETATLLIAAPLHLATLEAIRAAC